MEVFQGYPAAMDGQSAYAASFIVFDNVIAGIKAWIQCWLVVIILDCKFGKAGSKIQFKGC